MKKKLLIIFLLIAIGFSRTVYAEEKNGFYRENNNTFYYINGEIQKGITKIGEDYYFLGENTGRVVTGWVTSSNTGKTYYANNEGKLVTGFQTINGTKYYFSPEDCSLAKGLTKIGEDYYFLGENTGRVVTGWVTSSNTGKTYYANNEGKLVTGFQTINGTKYYFSPEDCSLAKGLTKIGEDYYFLGENTGRVVIGLVTSSNNGKTYYANNEGKLVTGFQTINGTRYYFLPEDYSLAKGLTKIGEDYYFLGENTGRVVIGWVTSSINGKIYYSNSDGILIKGDQVIEGNSYRFADDYSLETGWQTLSDGHTYYFYSDGTKAKYICKIAGTRYEFDANGRLEYSNIKQIADVSAHNGKIDWDTLWSSGEIDGVILRISAGAVNEDAMLAEYIQNVKRLNIPYGVYIYSYAENYDEGRIYANFTNNTMNRYNMKPTLGVYFDLESNVITSYLTPQLYEGIVRGFVDVLPFSKIYTYTYYANTALNTAYIHQYIDWIANYSVTERPGNYGKWQYTSKGKLPGINGNVDLSIFYN